MRLKSLPIKTSNAVDASMWQESRRRRWLKEDFDFEVAKSRKLCCGSVLTDQVRALFSSSSTDRFGWQDSIHLKIGAVRGD